MQKSTFVASIRKASQLTRDEAEQLLEILRFLATLQTTANDKQGASGTALKFRLNLTSVESLKQPLWFLFDNKSIEVVDIQFVITASGLKFMDFLDNDWNNLAYTPRNPLPGWDGSQVVLPFPPKGH